MARTLTDYAPTPSEIESIENYRPGLRNSDGTTTRQLVEGLPTEYRNAMTPTELSQVKQGMRDFRNFSLFGGNELAREVSLMNRVGDWRNRMLAPTTWIQHHTMGETPSLREFRFDRINERAANARDLGTDAREARAAQRAEQLRPLSRGVRTPIDPKYVTTQELADRGLKEQMYRNFPADPKEIEKINRHFERQRGAIRSAREAQLTDTGGQRVFDPLSSQHGQKRQGLKRLAKRAAGVVLDAAPAISAAYESVLGDPTSAEQGLRNLRDVTGRYPTRTPYAMSENLSNLARMVGGGEGAQYAASNVGQFADEAAGHFLEKAPRVADAATGGFASGLGGEIMSRMIEASQPEGRLRFIPEPRKLRGQEYGPTTIGIRG